MARWRSIFLVSAWLASGCALGSQPDDDESQASGGAGPGTGSTGVSGVGRGSVGAGGEGGASVATGSGAGVGAGPSTCSSTGQPVAAPELTWVWVEIPGMACGDGSPTGIALNLAPGSDRLLIYLEGGGACFDYASCAGLDQNHHAKDLDGFGIEKMSSAIASSYGTGSIFDRAAPTNPFKDSSFAIVPYCTGDLHAGDAVHDYGGGLAVHHVGHANVASLLPTLTATFCGAVSEVVLAGSSAGGAGAVFSYDWVASAFAPLPVTLIDDSFPLEGPAHMGLQAQMRAAWGAVDPTGCAACAGSWAEVVPFLAEKYPSRRFSLISSYQDPSICFYFGNSDPAVCKAALVDLWQGSLSALPGFRTYGIDAYEHVWFKAGSYLGASSGGVALTAWLDQQLTGAPGWSDVMP